MSQPANERIDLALGTKGFDVDPDICRDEACHELALHSVFSGMCRRRRINECSSRTRSKIFSTEPWRANCHGALRESVLNAVSAIEPRNFGTILQAVQNDYGTCCDRSVHRHLATLRAFGKIVRLDFHRRIHAYLLAGSRLIKDPDLVLEHIEGASSDWFKAKVTFEPSRRTFLGLPSMAI